MGYGKIYQYQEQQTSRGERKEGTKKWAGVQVELTRDLDLAKKAGISQDLSYKLYFWEIQWKNIKFNQRKIFVNAR